MIYLRKYSKTYGNAKIIKIKLNILGAIIEASSNINMLTSMIPTNSVYWINQQIDYHNNNAGTLGHDLFILVTRYSLKPFNFFIEKKYDDSLSYNLSMFNFNPNILLDTLIEYVKNSPLNQHQFTVYSGISVEDYEQNMVTIVDNQIVQPANWTSLRFRSATFDKKHALNYAIASKSGTSSKKLKKPHYLLKIIVSPETYCTYTLHENQILFHPNINLEFVEEKKYITKYKDIFETEDSKELYDVIELTYQTSMSSCDELYKHYKDKAINLNNKINDYRQQLNSYTNKNIVDEFDDEYFGTEHDNDHVYCEKQIKNVALLLLRKIKNIDEYELMLLTRSGDEKLMTPGGNIDHADVYDNNGNKIKNGCFKGLMREYNEETGYTMPRLNIFGSYIYDTNTKIYLAETTDSDIKFKPSDETISMMWINTKKLKNMDDLHLVRYVKKSISEIVRRGLLRKYMI